MKRMLANGVSSLVIGGLMVSMIACPANAEEIEPIAGSMAMTANTVVFLDRVFELVDTFENESAAIVAFEAEHPGVISAIRDSGDLPPLDGDTASFYKQQAWNGTGDGAVRPGWNEAEGFFDYLENRAENAEISGWLDDIEASYESGEIDYDEAMRSAQMMVPDKGANHAGGISVDVSTYAMGVNLTAARAYAETYATKYNPKYGYEYAIHDSADCTNFASQILLAGGISMDTYMSESSGWWWKAKNSRSISWRNADTFKNYMGSTYSTKRWNSFKGNVTAGDFIGLDATSDGIVDHIGFVYTTGPSGVYIAQHSSDYIMWNGGWPDKSGSGTYYRVRR